MAVEVVCDEDPGRVLHEAGAFLASDPVQHNLILTLLHERVAYPEPGRYWVATDGGAVVGMAFQSPLDFLASLTPTSPEAVAALVDAIAESAVTLPGVIGEAATAASGRMRKASLDDRDPVLAWTHNFFIDVGEDARDLEPMVERRLEASQFWLWEDGGPASMAANLEPVEGVVRLQAVYTPPEKRNRGYAGACVAGLSGRIREAGHRCILYTDLGNPTSNSVYRRIGYRAVAEGLRYRFE
jgi:uncharacterized protein